MRTKSLLASNIHLICLVTAMAVLVAGAGRHVYRAGFSSDEEITALTVAGIRATGWPSLPSHVLYLRGVLYTYFAWLAGAVGGYAISSYRLGSLLTAMLALVAFVYAGGRITTRTSAGWAAILLATFQPAVAAASFARFYSAFVATSLLAVWAFYRPRDESPRDAIFLASLALCRLTHEFAVTLALLPVCHALCAAGDARRRSLSLAAKSIGLVIVMEIAVAAIGSVSLANHVGPPGVRVAAFGSPAFVLPPFPLLGVGGFAATVLAVASLVAAGVVIRSVVRAPTLAVAAFVICGLLFQSGLLLLAVLVAVLWRPADRGRLLGAGALVAASMVAVWTILVGVTTSALLTWRLAYQLGSSTLWYPWEAVVHLAGMSPLITSGAALTVIRLVFRPHSEEARLRSFALFGIASLCVIGVTDVELQWRYLLLGAPAVLYLAADFVAYAGGRVAALMPTGSGSWVPGAGRIEVVSHAAAAAVVSALLTVLLIADHRGRVREEGSSSVAPLMVAGLAASTEASWRPDVFQQVVSPNDILVCNDELACAFLVGRVDYWLLPSERIVERFSAQDGVIRRGFYAGAKIVINEEELTRVVECSNRPVALVVLDTGKFDFDQSHALALHMADAFQGRTTSVGGRHIIVRFSDLQRKPGCTGGSQ